MSETLSLLRSSSLRTAGTGPMPMMSGGTPGDDEVDEHAERLDAQLLRLPTRSSPPRRRRRRSAATRCRPSPCPWVERGLQPLEPLERGLGPQDWCPRSAARPAALPASSNTRTLRGAISSFKPPLGATQLRLHLRIEGQLVLLVAGDVEARGHLLGRGAHRRVDLRVALHQLGVRADLVGRPWG